MARFDAQTVSLKDGRKVVFRHCAPEDAHLMPPFMASVARESTNTLQYEGRAYSVERIAKAWGSAAEDASMLYLGAFHGDRLVGEISIRQTYPDHPWVRHIGEFGMMVLKEFWGHGVGTRLLAEAERFALGAGITRIEAKVRTLNDRGLALYRKLGYAIEGTRKRAAWIQGQYQDEYFIAKLLGE